MSGGDGNGELLGDAAGEHRHRRHPLHAEATRWRHPADLGAHGPDDALAEHDEAEGDADAAVQRQKGGRTQVGFVQDPFLYRKK